jgi:L-ascorbate metabolism protein UlaG (beta-lactamase superfamily)
MNASLTFVGTATTILRLGPFTLLTDPNFVRRGQRVHLGYGLSSKRLTDPSMRVEDLPPLDALVLSHLHGDHFDRVARHGLPKELPILTTRHAAKVLGGWGFGETVALQTWESHSMQRDGWRLTVTSAPGVHGPGPLTALLPPVMGSVVELADASGVRLRLYVTGDTLCRPWLREVRERYPDLDAVVAHLGGTRVLGVLVTMDAEQGCDLAELLGKPLTIPIHYDDYGVFKSPLSDFVGLARLRRLPVRTVERGQTIDLPLRGATAQPVGLPLPDETST